MNIQLFSDYNSFFNEACILWRSMIQKITSYNARFLKLLPLFCDSVLTINRIAAYWSCERANYQWSLYKSMLNGCAKCKSCRTCSRGAVSDRIQSVTRSLALRETSVIASSCHFLTPLKLERLTLHERWVSCRKTTVKRINDRIYRH